MISLNQCQAAASACRACCSIVRHPPELGGSVAGPALVRRGEEIETAAGHVGILAELHAPSLNFGRAARQSTSVLISLPHAPSFLRAICSIPLFGIAKVAANVLSSRDTNKNANKPKGCGEVLRVFSTRHENFPENRESNQYTKLLLLFVFSVWCPWPILDHYHNHLKVKQFSSSIAADTNRNANIMTRGIANKNKIAGSPARRRPPCRSGLHNRLDRNRTPASKASSSAGRTNPSR